LSVEVRPEVARASHPPAILAQVSLVQKSSLNQKRLLKGIFGATPASPQDAEKAPGDDPLPEGCGVKAVAPGVLMKCTCSGTKIHPGPPQELPYDRW
jgi:hypothetical protein